jgi:hypothetical protein
MSVELPPFGSTTLVFSKELSNRSAPPVRIARTLPVTVLKPWTVGFQSDRGAPDGSVEMPVLKSWTESSDPAVRYFAGTATYRADLMAPDAQPGARIWLRLPQVREIARVFVNGKEAGTVWAKPLMLRMDAFLKPGVNHVEIEVTNLWPNRIIGDLQPAAREHITSTNIVKYRADSPLLPSGLIGDPEWVIER